MEAMLFKRKATDWQNEYKSVRNFNERQQALAHAAGNQIHSVYPIVKPQPLTDEMRQKYDKPTAKAATEVIIKLGGLTLPRIKPGREAGLPVDTTAPPFFDQDNPIETS